MSRKIPGPKINPQKSHAEFPSLKNYQALHCKRYNPKDNNSRERGKKNLCRTTWPGNAGTTTNLHIFFNTPPPPPPQKKQTDKQTKKNLLTSYLKQATQCKKSRNRKLQTPSTGERPWKIVSPPARQASMAVNSCLLYSTCMCDKLASGACGFCLQRAINYISKCGGIEPCFKPCGPVKRKCDFFNL